MTTYREVRSLGKDSLLRKLIIAALFLAACGTAITNPPASDAGVLDASWTAPTTNTDNTALVDLAGYKVYFKAGPTPCPGSQSMFVPSTVPNPGPGMTVQAHIVGLTVGTNYTVAVTAINKDGIESACSATANANARPSTPAPAGGVSVQ